LISLMVPGLMPPRLSRAHHSAWLCGRLWRRRVQGWRLPLPLPRLRRLRRLLLATTTAAAARGRTWRHGRWRDRWGHRRWRSWQRGGVRGHQLDTQSCSVRL